MVLSLPPFLYEKSKFYDSDSIAFGIETVVVLLVSITSAYGIGFALSSYWLPGQVMLVVKPMTAMTAVVQSSLHTHPMHA